MSEQLDTMKSSLMACAMKQMGDLEHTNAKELGEVVDMIKDIEEAKYYCAITKAMEKRSDSDETQSKIDNAIMMERIRNQSENSQNYYGGRMWYGDYTNGRMYYDGNSMNTNMNNSNSRSYTDKYYANYNPSYSYMPNNMRDYREGKSYIGRRGYMESKESHEPDSVKMEKLEEYIKELGEDVTEMIKDASPTERTTIRDKLIKLAQQIA